MGWTENRVGGEGGRRTEREDGEGGWRGRTEREDGEVTPHGENLIVTLTSPNGDHQPVSVVPRRSPAKLAVTSLSPITVASCSWVTLMCHICAFPSVGGVIRCFYITHEASLDRRGSVAPGTRV